MSRPCPRTNWTRLPPAEAQVATALNQVRLALDALSGNGWLPGAWFGAKLLLFALIFALGIGIDFAFRPIGPAFVQLATEGSSPALEARITAAVDGAIRYVLGLYALLIGIAFLGITKPF